MAEPLLVNSMIFDLNTWLKTAQGQVWIDSQKPAIAKGEVIQGYQGACYRTDESQLTDAEIEKLDDLDGSKDEVWFRRKQRLESALTETSGVDEARVDLQREEAVVVGGIDEAQLRERIRETGFRPGAVERLARAGEQTGVGVKEVLDSICELMPSPQDRSQEKTQALIFDSHCDEYRGVICYVRVFAGTLKLKQKIRFMGTKRTYIITEIGKIHTCFPVVLYLFGKKDRRPKSTGKRI